MPNHEDSQPGRRRGTNGVPKAVPEVDDETGIRIGLGIQALGANLAEHFRARRHVTAAQRAAESARLVAVLVGISGELDTLTIGMRALARQDLG
jgi:hypothetical protein